MGIFSEQNEQEVIPWDLKVWLSTQNVILDLKTDKFAEDLLEADKNTEAVV